MAKFQRKPLEKKNAIPHYQIIVLIPIILFFVLTIWFWGNDLVSYLLVIGLSVVEVALVLADGFLRKKQGGSFDRGDFMVCGAGFLATVYMIYLIIQLSKAA